MSVGSFDHSFVPPCLPPPPLLPLSSLHPSMDDSLLSELDATIAQLQKKISSRQISSAVKGNLRHAAATGHALRQAALRATGAAEEGEGDRGERRKRKVRPGQQQAPAPDAEPVAVETVVTQIRAFLEQQRSGKRRRPTGTTTSTASSRRGARPTSQSASTASLTESAALPLPKVAVPLRHCPLSPPVHEALIAADIAAAAHFLGKPVQILSTTADGTLIRAAAAIGCPRVVGLAYPVDLLLPPTYPPASSPHLVQVVCHLPPHAQSVEDAEKRLRKAIAERERVAKRYLRLEEVLELWSRACRIQPVRD
jgi:hypothetical protein